MIRWWFRSTRARVLPCTAVYCTENECTGTISACFRAQWSTLHWRDALLASRTVATIPTAHRRPASESRASQAPPSRACGAARLQYAEISQDTCERTTTRKRKQRRRCHQLQLQPRGRQPRMPRAAAHSLPPRPRRRQPTHRRRPQRLPESRQPLRLCRAGGGGGGAGSCAARGAYAAQPAAA